MPRNARSTTRGRSSSIKRSSTKRGRSSKTPTRNFKRKGPIKKGPKKSFSKKGSLNNTAQQVGNAHWLSYGKTFATKGNNFLRKLEKALTPSFQVTTSTNQLTCLAGLQVMYQSAIYSDGDLQAINAGLGLYTGSDAANNVETRMLLVSAKEKFTFTNTSNTNVFIDIYDIVNRRDVMYSEQTLSYLTPTGTWTQGDLNTPANTDESSIYGSTPFQSRMFCLMYKILRKTRINLTNGETAEHIKHTRPNRIWDSMLDNITPGGTLKGAGYQYIKNLTNWTMFVCYAAPGSNHAVATTVSTAAPVIDFIHTVEYKSTTLLANITQLTVSNNISAAGVTNITAFGAGLLEAVENAS